MIAVGGKSKFPIFKGNEFMINSDKALDLEKLPKSIIIYGSGYIAVEFAGIFSGFGVDTSLVFRSDYLLRGFDIDVRKKLTEQIEKSGVRIFPNNVIEAMMIEPTESETKETLDRFIKAMKEINDMIDI